MKITLEKIIPTSFSCLVLTGCLFASIPSTWGMVYHLFPTITGFRAEPDERRNNTGFQICHHGKSYHDINCTDVPDKIFFAENVPKSPPSTQAVNTITEISFEILHSGQEKVIISGTGISPPHIFALEGESPRVVCDFKGTELAHGVGRAIITNGRLIRKIRTGLSKDDGGKVRVVLDLSPEGSYEVEQTFYKTKHTYELIIKPDKSTLE